VPNLRDFERRLGGLVEGLFSKTFRSGLQPVELAKTLVKEQDAGRTVSLSRVWAPNAFAFTLSPDDAATFEQAEVALSRELATVARENADERGWGLMGPVEITFGVDDTLRKGDFLCDASLVEGEGDGSAGASAGSAAPVPKLVVRADGAQHVVDLSNEVMTVGRLGECDFVVDDEGASRRHAQLRTSDGVTTVTDLGSTNGTYVNGRTVQSRELADGDKITIGTTVLEYRSR
jgi:hypothetical protein